VKHSAGRRLGRRCRRLEIPATIFRNNVTAGGVPFGGTLRLFIVQFPSRDFRDGTVCTLNSFVETAITLATTRLTQPGIGAITAIRGAPLRVSCPSTITFNAERAIKSN